MTGRMGKRVRTDSVGIAEDEWKDRHRSWGMRWTMKRSLVAEWVDVSEVVGTAAC